MITGGYQAIHADKFPLIDAAMKPVPLNPEARYLIAASEFTGADGQAMGDERRFGVQAKDVLTATQLSSLRAPQAGQGVVPGSDLKPGDMLSVLNCGFVEFMDVMGDDDSVADAARTSYTGGKTKQKNAGLLRYLLRHHHTTPFEMGEIKFRLYLPIFVYRQLFRHRTASQLEPEVADCISNDTAFQMFSVQNEMSGRYVEMPDHYYLPEPGAIHIQSLDNKQGRSDGGLTIEEKLGVRSRLESEIREMRSWYGKSLKMNLAKELARANLPLSQYTLLIWKIDLKNLLHFIKLRIHPHAQYEVREYARALLAVVWSTFPVTAQAFDDYELGAQRFSRMEMEALLAQLSPKQREAAVAAYKQASGNAREVGEFGAKLGI